MKRIFVALVVASVSGAAIASECPAGRTVPVKEGHFGAKNVRAYNTMISMQVRKQREGLEKMIEGGMVVQLPAEREVCVVRDVVTSFRTQVVVPGQEGTYWVHANALDR